MKRANSHGLTRIVTSEASTMFVIRNKCSAVYAVSSDDSYNSYDS